MNELSDDELAALRVKLKDHIEFRLASLETLIEAKLMGIENRMDTANRVSQEKVETANNEMKIRLGTMNEWRGTVTDILGTMLTRAEHQAWKEKVESALGDLRDFKIMMDTKASAKSLQLSYVISFASLAIGFASLAIGLASLVVTLLRLALGK